MAEHSEIEKELHKEIRDRYFYGRFDFTFNHILVAIAVLASAYPAFARISGITDSYMVSLIAAIPAFILLIQQTFKFDQRAEWHWRYRRRVRAIWRRMRDQGLKPNEASGLLNSLEAEFEGTFPGLSRPSPMKEND